VSAKARIFPLLQPVFSLPHRILLIFFSALYDHTRVCGCISSKARHSPSKGGWAVSRFREGSIGIGTASSYRARGNASLNGSSGTSQHKRKKGKEKGEYNFLLVFESWLPVLKCIQSPHSPGASDKQRKKHPLSIIPSNFHSSPHGEILRRDPPPF